MPKRKLDLYLLSDDQGHERHALTSFDLKRVWCYHCQEKKLFTIIEPADGHKLALWLWCDVIIAGVSR